MVKGGLFVKRTKMNSQQKKDTAVIAVLSIVVILLFVFCVKAFRTENVPVVNTTVSEETTSANVTTGTTAEPPVTTTKPAQTTKPVVTTSSAETTKVVAVDETAEILKVVSDGVNSLKASDASFTGHKVQSIDIHLVDSSVPAVNNIINGIIKAFVKEEIYDYDFTNGVSSDPEGDGTVNTNETFPPGDKPFELTKEGVARAYKDTDGENTVYTVVIVPETAPLFGIVPVTSTPFTNAVSPLNISPATAVAPDVSASYVHVPVVASPLGKWNVTPSNTSALVT